MKNRIKVGFDLFQMEQLDHILREIEENPELKHRLIMDDKAYDELLGCLLYTSPSPRDS